MKKIMYSLCFLVMISTASYAQTSTITENTPATKPAVGAAELPEHVKAYVNKKFPGYIVVSFRKNETQEMTTTPYFDVEVEKGKKAYTVRVSEDGKLLEKKAKKPTAGKASK